MTIQIDPGIARQYAEIREKTVQEYFRLEKEYTKTNKMYRKAERIGNIGFIFILLTSLILGISASIESNEFMCNISLCILMTLPLYFLFLFCIFCVPNVAVFFGIAMNANDDERFGSLYRKYVTENSDRNEQACIPDIKEALWTFTCIDSVSSVRREQTHWKFNYSIYTGKNAGDRKFCMEWKCTDGPQLISLRGKNGPEVEDTIKTDVPLTCSSPEELEQQIRLLNTMKEAVVCKEGLHVRLFSDFQNIDWDFFVFDCHDEDLLREKLETLCERLLGRVAMEKLAELEEPDRLHTDDIYEADIAKYFRDPGNEANEIESIEMMFSRPDMSSELSLPPSS